MAVGAATIAGGQGGRAVLDEQGGQGVPQGLGVVDRPGEGASQRHRAVDGGDDGAEREFRSVVTVHHFCQRSEGGCASRFEGRQQHAVRR